MVIKRLTISNLEAYKAIRLELLEKHPESFGSSHIEEKNFTELHWRNRLTKDTVSSFGAFIDDEIVGLCVLVRNPRGKMKHVATLNSIYVREKYRGNGIAKKLILSAIEHASLFDVERIHLSVVTVNIVAYQLYKKLGFSEYGIETDSIKYKNQYYDQRLLSKLIK